MQLNITARHLDLTPALSDYVHKKVEKAQRYFDSIIWAQAILSVEKHRHIAEVIVHTPGNTFRTKGEAGDLYSAVDLAAHKLDLHLTRVKDKQKNHRRCTMNFQHQDLRRIGLRAEFSRGWMEIFEVQPNGSGYPEDCTDAVKHSLLTRTQNFFFKLGHL